MRKARPANGPGANGLRGGLNVYSNGKTAVGHWMEEYGGPGGYKRGFSTEEFETEGQHLQMGFINNEKPELFGAPLPPRISGLDNSAQELKSKDWATVARSEFPGIDNRPVEWKPSMNMSKDETKAYISQWCSDNECGRTIRFESEAQRAGNAAAKADLKVSRVRLLPGTPLSMEKMRAILIEKHGVLAFVALRANLPADEGTDVDLRAALNKLGCSVQSNDRILAKKPDSSGDLTKLEFSQIMASITKDVTFATSDLFAALLGRDKSFVEAPVTAVFRQAFREMASPTDILESINNKEYPEIHQGLSEYLVAYTTEDILMEGDFVQLHTDLYCANPAVFASLLTSLWTIGQ